MGGKDPLMVDNALAMVDSPQPQPSTAGAVGRGGTRKWTELLPTGESGVSGLCDDEKLGL